MNTEKTISFISDRKHYDIPESSILYISMKKQDAFIHGICHAASQGDIGEIPHETAFDNRVACRQRQSH